MSYIPLNLRPVDPNIKTDSATEYNYTNRADEIATMLIPGYFSKTIESDQNVASDLKIDDLIYLVSGELFDRHGSLEVKVKSVDPIVTLSMGIKMRDAFIAVTSGGATSETFGAPASLATDLVIATLRTRTPGTLELIRASMQSDEVVELFFNVDPGVSSTISVITIRNDLG